MIWSCVWCHLGWKRTEDTKKLFMSYRLEGRYQMKKFMWQTIVMDDQKGAGVTTSYSNIKVWLLASQPQQQEIRWPIWPCIVKNGLWVVFQRWTYLLVSFELNSSIFYKNVSYRLSSECYFWIRYALTWIVDVWLSRNAVNLTDWIWMWLDLASLAYSDGWWRPLELGRSKIIEVLRWGLVVDL